MTGELNGVVVQAFYTRYEEYVSLGEPADDSALMASQEVKAWMKEGSFGNLSDEQIAEAEVQLKNTGLYAL